MLSVGEFLLFIAGVLSITLVGVVVFRDKLMESIKSILTIFIILFFLGGAFVISMVCGILIGYGGVGFFFVPFVFVGGIALVIKVVDWLCELIEEDGE